MILKICKLLMMWCRFGLPQTQEVQNNYLRALLQKSQTSFPVGYGANQAKWVIPFRSVYIFIVKHVVLSLMIAFMMSFWFPITNWHLQDLEIIPKYLVAFTVGNNQKKNIDACVKKVSFSFYLSQTHMLFPFLWS